ncbi:nuclear RNA export factor 1/2 [Trypanosoma rangeli]|uniref:Nuclear RNA export factor 1/2 n=1 Tax=Trypanosoma rangeli TaxID=5698 RepID=A0A3R7NID6_TRYRA|nr:nuclear RNA export factor 1/2 [Trypanosoma rangeli]RNF03082.1 nuclear RNA export factor 1/2 [Trypanosoma rangeli]|eukprot:RNF03082.1 nuclear RNA export factor 1/2 [Trypanosoma rangeli]
MSAPYKKTNTHNVPCFYFKRGACTNQRCPYLHVRGKESGGNAGAVKLSSVTLGLPDAATNLLSTMLKLVFEKQQQRVYDASSGMLDLSELRKFPDLKDVSNSINFNTQNFCRALCSTIKSLIVPPPSAMQLKGNDITSLFHLAGQMEKADLHMSLRALSLEANNIRTMDALQELKKFMNLQELVLVGNPVAKRDDYRMEVKKALPFLLGLDGEGIAVPPLLLPWPRFATSEYTDAQRHVLQFVQCSLLNPLEAGEVERVSQGVDAVSDIYAQKAILTISLSSPEAAVSSPARSVNGFSLASTQRNVIREIVGLRLKQTESNHNLLHGVKSSVVACGRTKVCSQLEHWLYPKNFAVQHFVHSSASASFLDNTYLSGPAPVAMKVPVTVVTLHGVMTWTHLSPQSQNNSDRVVIYRNFTRVLTVQQNEAGRWLVTNDMVSLYLFSGKTAGLSKKGEANADISADVSECRILFSPRTDRSRAELLGRKKDVPVEVVLALSQHVSNDAELMAVLGDIGGVPLSMYEHCAALTGENILESIQVCRIGNRFGLAPQEGLELLRRVGGNWCAVEEAMGTAVGVTTSQVA